MKKTFNNFQFRAVEVDFDYERPEPATGYRGGYTLNSVKIDGCYIDKVWQHSDLTDLIIAKLEEDRQGQRFEHALNVWGKFPATNPKCQACGLELLDEEKVMLEDGKPFSCSVCGANYENIPIDHLIDRAEDR